MNESTIFFPQIKTQTQTRPFHILVKQDEDGNDDEDEDDEHFSSDAFRRDCRFSLLNADRQRIVC
jgi:hypothetical protein